MITDVPVSEACSTVTRLLRRQFVSRSATSVPRGLEPARHNVALRLLGGKP